MKFTLCIILGFFVIGAIGSQSWILLGPATFIICLALGLMSNSLAEAAKQAKQAKQAK